MGDYETIRLILSSLKKHKNEIRVVKNACMALATIVEADGKIIITDIILNVCISFICLCPGKKWNVRIE